MGGSDGNGSHFFHQEPPKVGVRTGAHKALTLVIRTDTENWDGVCQQVRTNFTETKDSERRSREEL